MTATVCARLSESGHGTVKEELWLQVPSFWVNNYEKESLVASSIVLGEEEVQPH